MLHVLGIENLADAMQGSRSTTGIGALQVFLHPARRRGLRHHQLCRAGPASVLLQQQSMAGVPIAWARA